MEVIYGVHNIGKFKKPVVALGVFDGLHLGHQHILKSAVSKARRIRGTAVVLTFWPHPQKKQSIYSLEHRLRLFAKLHLDAAVVMHFTRAFAALSAEDFIGEILAKRIQAWYVYVGKNFHFGKNASGDFKLLEKLSGRYGFRVKAFSVLKSKDSPISSTTIRQAILKGRLQDAKKLLGRPVNVLGTVIRGTALGKITGIPTANINPHHEVLPPSGIYAVKIMFAGRSYNGVCYIGHRPTLRKTLEKRIEAHIFNFHKNIYGEDLEIRFLRKLRNDQKFPSLKSLILQMRQDIAQAKQYLNRL